MIKGSTVSYLEHMTNAGPSGYAIETHGLTKQFNGFTAVDHVDLRVEEGEIFGFLGPNGAGKTTTIRMLCTLLKPSSGSPKVGCHVVHEAECSCPKRATAFPLAPKQSGACIWRKHALLRRATRREQEIEPFLFSRGQGYVYW
jgi:ABC-type uncharacterized transport system ATPase subunit